jgi:hypothetical protein
VQVSEQRRSREQPGRREQVECRLAGQREDEVETALGEPEGGGREGHGERTARDDEQEPLGEQWQGESGARGAERRAHRGLVPRLRGARGEQGGEVGRHREQHQGADGADQRRLTLDPRPLVGSADARVGVRHHPGMRRIDAVARFDHQRIGELLGELRQAGVELGLRLLERSARRQTRDEVEPRAAARRHQLAVAGVEPRVPGRHRHPERRRHRRIEAGEAARSDSHDGQRLAVDANLSPDDSEVGAEARAPEIVRDHDHRRAAIAVVGKRQQAADGRADAEQFEVIGGDDTALQSQAVAPSAWTWNWRQST